MKTSNILRAAFGGIVVLALLVAAGWRPVDTPDSVYYEQARDATYKILAHQEEYPNPNFGSGVMIAPNYFLTAAHVIDKENAWYELEQGGEIVSPARVIYKNVEEDLAIMWVSIGCPCVEPASRGPYLHEKVFTVGYPKGVAQVLTTGMVDAYTTRYADNGYPELLVTTVPSISGNSGGGLFGVVRGKLRVFGVHLAGLYHHTSPVTFIGLYGTFETLSAALDCITPGKADDDCNQYLGD